MSDSLPDLPSQKTNRSKDLSEEEQYARWGSVDDNSRELSLQIFLAQERERAEIAKYGGVLKSPVVPTKSGRLTEGKRASRRSFKRLDVNSKELTGVDKAKTDEAIRLYLSSLDCPRSLAVWLLYESKAPADHDQLVAFECNPEDYNTSESFRDSYRSTHFLRKSDFLNTSVQPDVVALANFEKAEAKCRDTNRTWLDRRFANDDWNAIHRVSRKILAILGPKPDIEEWVDASSWGPGASISIKARDASSFKKYRDEPGLTVDASLLADYIGGFYPLLTPRTFSWELGDKLVVVPNDARKSRVILIQPGWNLWFQKGLGSMIRRRLRRSGLDLDEDSPTENKARARLSSLTGEDATVDFSSASDLIAIEPLREVLPPDWFRLLDLVRSKRSVEGRTWNKFSSMGNGFTFELESLIFYAIGLVAIDRSGARGTCSVFGDDVVLPTVALPTFLQMTDLFGFTVNASKTFASGQFRESCGEHFFAGVDCKPVFLKKKISDIQHVYRLYNAIRMRSHDPSNRVCDGRFERCCRKISEFIPRELRFRIPSGYGEVGFISNWDEATPSKHRDKLGPSQWEGWCFRALIAQPLKFESEEPPILMVRLREHSDRPRHNDVEVKSRTKRALKTLYASEWYNLGNWLA